jgi:hypothetical protein
MRLFRTVFAAVVFAVLGVMAGRAFERWRRPRDEAQPLDFAALQPRPRELIPGLIAALRVRDQPWSYLRIPSWLAAFGVNFAVVALSRELGPLLEALGFASADEADDELEPTPIAPPRRPEIWTAEVPPEPPVSPASTPGFRPFTG